MKPWMSPPHIVYPTHSMVGWIISSSVVENKENYHLTECKITSEEPSENEFYEETDDDEIRLSNSKLLCLLGI